MQKYGIDTRRYEEDGSLVIQKGEEIYKDPSKPDLEFHKRQANDVVNYFMKKGKKGLRVATDLTSFFSKFRDLQPVSLTTE